MNNPTEVEIMPEQSVQPELQVIVQQNALQPDTARSLQASFAPLFNQARGVIEKSRGIVVTDAAQKLEMKMAKACRLELKALRVAGEKTRKELKEESLRKGKAIDGFNAILVDLISSEETRLQAQEDFVERQEEQRRATLKAEREKVLAAIQVDPNLYQLADMTEETFGQLVEGTKLARAAEAERKRKEEAERIERETKEAAERERIRLENERLKKEAEEKEAALKAERERVAKEESDRKAAEQAEQKRREQLHAVRRDNMQTFIESGDESQNAQYGHLTDDQYAEVQSGAFNRRNARLKAEATLKAERQRAAEAEAKAKAEREAAEKRLADERRAAEEKAATERKRIEAEKKAADEKARIEREESERKFRVLEEAARKQKAADDAAKAELEKKLQAQRKAQERQAAAEKEAARKAEAAPDKDKLFTYANEILAVKIPEFSTPEAKAIGELIRASRDKFVFWIEEKGGAL